MRLLSVCDQIQKSAHFAHVKAAHAQLFARDEVTNLVVPDHCAEIGDLVGAGRLDEARTLQRRLTPLARTIGGLHGVPALKAALDLMGYDGGLPRSPLRPTPKPVVETLRRQLTDLGVPLVEPAPSDTDAAVL